MKMLLMSVLLLFVSKHASAVEVYEGVESVVLPCHVPVDVSSDSTAVWDQDEFKIPTVHVRDPSGDDLSDQNYRYRDRTSMFADALQTGDLSLSLRKPTVSDSGTYTCITRRFGQDLKKVYVQLKVTEPPPVWPKVLAAVLVTLIIVAAAIGLFVCCAYKRMKDREVNKVEALDLPEGEGSVLLPLKTTDDLREGVKVEWTLTEHKRMKVHVYESGNNQPDKQVQCYRGRTEMKKDPLRTKDLILTLKDLHLTDSGVYTCTVYNKDGHMLLQTVAILNVRVAQPKTVKVPQEKESVLLPFKTTADLPQDVTVEWRHNNMKVHVYESGKHQLDKQDQHCRGRTEMDEDPLRTKDFSLTLKDLHLTDSGVYTCSVYNKDGHMLLQKSVRLRVRVPQSEEVENEEWEYFVLLPFKTTADLPQDVTVEWRRKHMQVHVYESGNNQPDKQNQGYRGRTEMKEDPLRTKDLSLTLKDLRPADSGVYTCTVYNKHGDKLLQKSVRLSVRALLPEVLKVPQGETSFLLPFKTTAGLPQDVTVEWTVEWRCKQIKVHVYESGNNHPDKQHQDFRGRTEMKGDPLRTKDLSLTLKHVRPTDSGVYTCTVYNKDGEELLRKVVILNVRVAQPEVEGTQGQESALLPLKTTDDFPQDVTVEWRRKQIKVHMYENGNNQPDKQHQDYRGRTEMKEDPLRTKDLSLTLKHLRLTDRGVYTCTVYNKDGLMLLQKSVRLRVAQPKVVKVPQEKESVLLPFKTTADLPQDVTVEWRHNNMKVHVYESGNNQPDKQDQHYRGRTEMDEDPLRTKDFSLTLKDLHLTDSGVYTCSVYNKHGHMLLQKVVILSVRVAQPEVVEVPQGQEPALLPFKTTADLPQDVRVEWRRKQIKVHVYESGNNQPVKQDQGYIGRTEMKEDPLTNKDLSLTLKDLHLTDFGVYTCTVYNKYGHKLLQKSVTLSVTGVGMQMVVTEGLKFVMLPFKIPCDLPQGTTVEWRRKQIKVHVYESGNNQPDKQDQHYRGRTEMDEDPLTNKDLSLTLKHLHLTDSGVYTCTVYNKDGEELLRKVVILSVRDNRVEMVEVPRGEKSVLLPFITTADLPQDVTVEWRRSDYNNMKVTVEWNYEEMKVHVYENGNNQPDKQDQGYRGRTEMKKDPLRTKDFSLTLKDLRPTDSGVYTCTVSNKHGHMLLQKVVTLRVGETLKGAMADMLACLRRRTPKSAIKGEMRYRNHEDVPLMEVHSA